MISSEVASKLNFEDNGSKIVLFVIDGLGGLPMTKGGLTELETARTPHLDELVTRGITGMTIPVAPGVTPGSGVAHLALFGYDPLKHAIGRGAVAAYGVGLDMEEGDVAVRINFAGYSQAGSVLDRRAGRLATEKNEELCKLLRGIKLPGAEFIMETVLDYRSVVVFKGEGLHAHLNDSDPQAIGDDVLPHEIKALDPKAEKMAEVARIFIERANDILRDKSKDIAPLPYNQHIGILTRGYAGKPDLPRMQDLYGFKKMGVIATYPDYRGVARISGMDVVYAGHAVEGEFDALEALIEDHDFIFFHIKKTDSAGEDGDFEKRVNLLEELDELIPRLANLNPDVIVFCGDHSTPARLKAHGWHPVPFALVSELCRPDDVTEFSERACSKGALGQFQAAEVMLHALGHAGRIEKFGA